MRHQNSNEGWWDVHNDNPVENIGRDESERDAVAPSRGHSRTHLFRQLKVRENDGRSQVKKRERQTEKEEKKYEKKRVN